MSTFITGNHSRFGRPDFSGEKSYTYLIDELILALITADGLMNHGAVR